MAASADRCEAARDDIRAATGNPRVDFVAADLSSQRQVRQMAAEINARYDRLHVLINNAGVILLQRQLSEDGVELSFAVNHLAPFLLTRLLLDVLKTERARAHRQRQFDGALRRAAQIRQPARRAEI